MPSVGARIMGIAYLCSFLAILGLRGRRIVLRLSIGVDSLGGI